MNRINHLILNRFSPIQDAAKLKTWKVMLCKKCLKSAPLAVNKAITNLKILKNSMKMRKITELNSSKPSKCAVVLSWAAPMNSLSVIMKEIVSLVAMNHRLLWNIETWDHHTWQIRGSTRRVYRMVIWILRAFKIETCVSFLSLKSLNIAFENNKTE